MTKEFMAKEDHLAQLIESLSDGQQRLYSSMRHTRAESCYRGRTLIVYEMSCRESKVLEEIEVMDFITNDEDGASTEIRSKTTGRVMQVSYTPAQLFDHPVFVFLPLYSRTRWCSAPGAATGIGSLAFDLVIRTQSRRHLRERNVVYCETGVIWSKEFQSAAEAA